LVLMVAVLVAAVTAGSASATHSWGGYHWARTANPFTLKLGNNVGATWDSLLVKASSDWSNSAAFLVPPVLRTDIVAGGTRPRQCRPTSGRDEICSANYGNTGWLGVAQIWITGGVHITQGTVKNNDYYFGSSTYQYNNTMEMQHVICQEIGHTFGLDHQSTTGESLNTCMDYYHNTSNTDTLSTSPNKHDYDELVTIYSHYDSTTTIGAAASGLPAAVPDFAPAGEHASVYTDHLPNGDLLVTFVTWATPFHLDF